MAARSSTAPFESIVLVGVGLIGGSIAAAVRLRQVARTVIGVGRNRKRLEAAREAGIIDQVATDFDEIASASLVVICTPVDRIVEDVHRAATLGPGTLITDAGSVKACLVRELQGKLPEGVTFVGSHPMAGSEKTGWENGRADLFVNRVCVLTPEEDDPQSAIRRVEDFWQSIGMRTLWMSADDHDRAVAATSHVPHVAAAAIVALINDSNATLASTGFRDLTRIASGDPALWVAILQGNKPAVLAELDRLSEQLARYRDALAVDDCATVEHLLEAARQRRLGMDL